MVGHQHRAGSVSGRRRNTPHRDDRGYPDRWLAVHVHGAVADRVGSRATAQIERGISGEGDPGVIPVLLREEANLAIGHHGRAGFGGYSRSRHPEQRHQCRRLGADQAHIHCRGVGSAAAGGVSARRNRGSSSRHEVVLGKRLVRLGRCRAVALALIERIGASHRGRIGLALQFPLHMRELHRMHAKACSADHHGQRHGRQYQRVALGIGPKRTEAIQAVAE